MVSGDRRSTFRGHRAAGSVVGMRLCFVALALAVACDSQHGDDDDDDAGEAGSGGSTAGVGGAGGASGSSAGSGAVSGGRGGSGAGGAGSAGQGGSGNVGGTDALGGTSGAGSGGISAGQAGDSEGAGLGGTGGDATDAGRGGTAAGGAGAGGTSGTAGGGAGGIGGDGACAPATRGSSSYVICSNVGVDWPTAAEYCASIDSALVKLDDAEEDTWLFETVVAPGSIWIGANDREMEGDWRWPDGTALTGGYEGWVDGQPNDSGAGEDCAVLHSGEGGWNDVDCAVTAFSEVLLSFVCETP